MATVYLDFVNGSDSNSGLTPLLPKKTYTAAEGVATAGDTLLMAKCGTVTTVSPGGNFVWTRGSATVTAPTGHGFVVGNWIGTSTAAANGSSDGYYYVYGAAANTITLLAPWYGAANNITEASAKKMVPVAATIANTKSLTLIGGHTTGETWTRDGETLISASTGTICTAVANTNISYLNCYGTTGYCFAATTSTEFAFCSAGNRTLANPAIGFNGGKCTTAGSSCFAVNGDRGFFNVIIDDGTHVANSGTNGFYNCTINNGTCNAYGNTYGTNSGTINGGTVTVANSTTTGIYTTTINGGTTSSSSNQHGFYGVTITGGTNTATNNTLNGFYSASNLNGGTNSAVSCPTGFNSITINGGTNSATSCTTYGFSSGTHTGGTSTATSCPIGYNTCTLLGGTNNAVSCSTAGFSSSTAHGSASLHTESCAIGIYPVDSGPDFLFANWTSLNDTIGLQMRPGRGKVRLVNCQFTTPVTAGIVRDLTAGCVECIGCSIDAPSLAKAYQVISGASYVAPQYLMQNSFGITGVIYANATILQDTTTSPYSLNMLFTGTSGLQKMPLSILKLWVKQATALTVSVQYKAPTGSWSGTIVPYLLLNGKTIATGTTISSVSSSPATLTFTATAEQITSDGVLEIAVVPNSNAVTVNWSNPTYQKN